MVRLETVLESWKTIRDDTAQAVEDVPAGALDYRPIDQVMSFRENARHILDASHGLTGVLLAGGDNFAVPEFREKMKPYYSTLPADAGAAELAGELRRALGERCSEFAAQSESFFAGEITRFDGQRVTRLEMLQFLKEHELTHRAQLFLYLRLNGVVPSTTRRRLAKAKA